MVGTGIVLIALAAFVVIFGSLAWSLGNEAERLRKKLETARQEKDFQRDMTNTLTDKLVACRKELEASRDFNRGARDVLTRFVADVDVLLKSKEE